MKVQLIFTSDGLLKLVHPKYSSQCNVCKLPGGFVPSALMCTCSTTWGHLGIPQCSSAHQRQ